MQILKKLWLAISFAISLAYIITSCSYAISALQFPYSFVLALGFPVLLIVHLAAAVISILVHRKIGIVLLLITLLGWQNIQSTIGWNATAKFNQQKQPDHLRILNWNVAYWSSLKLTDTPKSQIRTKMLNLIKIYKPDVLCLQEHAFLPYEGYFDIKKALKQMGYVYTWYPNVITSSITKSYDGTIIFSRLPLKNNQYVETGLGVRNEALLSSEISVNGKKIKLITFHLLSYALFTNEELDKGFEAVYTDGDWSEKSAIYKLKKVDQMHYRQLQHIRKMINESPYPVVVCGDFNTTPTHHIVHAIKGDMQDAFLQKNFGIGRTFSEISPFLRIDYCFVDKRLKVEQNTRVKKKLSDHYPLITDISIP